MSADSFQRFGWQTKKKIHLVVFICGESKEAMETFMQSDLVAAVVSRPFVKNVSSVDYTVNEAASRITRGLK